MGVASSTATKFSTPLLIERIIAPGIIVGVNKNGEQLKINDNYHNLVEVVKVNNRLEYMFEPNINLTLERTNEKSSFGNYKLFYKLTQDRNVLMGETVLPYKTIGLNSPKLDLIAEIQNMETSPTQNQNQTQPNQLN